MCLKYLETVIFDIKKTLHDSNRLTMSLNYFVLIHFIVYAEDKRVDLITCFTTLHHVPQLSKILSEFVRILRPNGYLIVREHDCKWEYSLKMKYLNFIHGVMMIARVGEFASESTNYLNNNKSDSNSGSSTGIDG